MCGIVGVWNQSDKNTVQQMMALLAHRGPDGSGIWSDEVHTTFGHDRLAIMDPKAGRQPLQNEDGSLTVVANGEIYNYPEIYRKLNTRHTFQTGSDSEALVHLFEDRRSSMVRSLDGMYAFALTDGERLVLARDHIGIKPLYYGYRENEPQRAMLFASEMKALTPFVARIHEFPPGYVYDSGTGFHRYYSVPKLDPQPQPLEHYTQQVRKMIEESVVKQLMSNVPLGVFLSGGLDSAIIAALARPHLDKLHTFAVGVEGSSDVEAARYVAQMIGAIHHEYLFTAEELLAELPRIIYHLESFDQDLVRSAIPCYFCSRLAAEHVKVVLTGEGSDELFAGYGYYKDIGSPDALHRELRRSVKSLHHINLQRLDRMSMAHGLEGRVPFLSRELVDFSFQIPPQWKIYRDESGQVVEKWILRKAFEGLLPPNILWRTKEQFDEGSGTVELMERVLHSYIQNFDTSRSPLDNLSINLRSSEERFYHRIFTEVFDHPDRLLPNIGRWSHRPQFKMVQ